MPRVANHVNGSFSWIELGTTDQNAGKAFYTNLFGWTYTDSPMGPDDVYTMFQIDGQNVGAAYTMKSDERAAGVPPHWNLYVTVESADRAAQKAQELGGTVVAGPFDVFTYGRMAVILDPAGAAFEVWEPKQHIGAGIKGESGTLCWADLNTHDASAAQKFYGGLFGWTFLPGDGGYLHIKNGDDFIGGIPSAAHVPPGAPPHWMIYIQVANCDASTAKAKALGGTVCLAPMTIEKAGKMSVVQDGQGAAFALFQLVHP
jgi:hypothetical protein